MQEYLHNGARLGWLIDPIERVVYVYRPGEAVERLEAPGEVSGESVLPRASHPEHRLRAIEALSAAGIPVGVMVAPIIPGLNESQFGKRMRGEGVFAEQIALLFKLACRQAGLAHTAPALSTDAFRRPAGPQLTLFD